MIEFSFSDPINNKEVICLKGFISPDGRVSTK